LSERDERAGHGVAPTERIGERENLALALNHLVSIDPDMGDKWYDRVNNDPVF
jgi:hypothetical protein